MKIFITVFLFFIVSSMVYGQLTPVNLGNWTHEGLLANGNWTISADSSAVVQSVNDEPTFFVSPDTFENVTIRGSFSVSGGDDDYIGFVFGYQRPVGEEEFFDFFLLDWKGRAQAGAQEGFTLSEVLGFVDVGSGTNTSHPYWNHTDTTQSVLATLYGTAHGWNSGTAYDFELIYEPNRIRISIDSTQIFDISGAFQPGRFGFYNYSQPGVTYQNFSLNEAPVAVDDNVITREDSTLTINPILNDIDADGNDITITMVGDAMHGTIDSTMGDSLIYYTPDENFFGVDSFLYHISDGNGGVDSATVVINVLSVNDPPVRVSLIPDGVINENVTGIFYVTINNYFSDVDDNDAFLDDISVVSNGGVTANSLMDSLFLSSSGFVGFDTLIVSVADDSGATATDTFIVEVLNQNTPPFVVQTISDTVINLDSYDIFYRKLNDVFSDYDANDVPLDSFSINTIGIVSASLTSDSLYISSNNVAGFDTLTVTAVDDSGAMASDTFVVQVLPVSAVEDLFTPRTFSLAQNYPNPFNPSTTIVFTLPEQKDVSLEIYDTIGRKIKTLLSKKMAAGTHKVKLRTENLPSGVYLYRIEAGEYKQVRKMILIR